uniref:FGGY_N domain-containing protein n=1 Tax=Macrostomum lignano TaxID=282301 RepID=A0A1I8FBJ6_9PLAT
MGWGARGDWRRRTVRCRTGTRGVAEDTDSCGLPLLQGVCRRGQLAADDRRLRALRPDARPAHRLLAPNTRAEFGHDRWGSRFQRPAAGLWAGLGPRTAHAISLTLAPEEFTIRLLQHLLATDFWGRGTSAAWVKSVTCIASPLNGSTATYLYGSSRDTGLFQWPSLVPLVSCVELIETLQGVPSERRGRLRHWRLEHWARENEDFRSYSRLKCQAARPQPGLPDRQGQPVLRHQPGGARLELNGRIGADQPDCHYLSVLTCCTSSALGGFVRPSGHCGAFLLLPCAFMCAERVDHRLPGADVADWRHNDGLVPLGSQRMPFFGAKAAGADSAGRRRWCRRRHAGQQQQQLAPQRGRPLALRVGQPPGRRLRHRLGPQRPRVRRSLIWEPPRQRWSFTPALLDGAAAAARWLGLRREGGSFAKVARDKQKTFYERLYRLLAEIP